MHAPLVTLSICGSLHSVRLMVVGPPVGMVQHEECVQELFIVWAEYMLSLQVMGVCSCTDAGLYTAELAMTVGPRKCMHYTSLELALVLTRAR